MSKHLDPPTGTIQKIDMMSDRVFEDTVGRSSPWLVVAMLWFPPQHEYLALAYWKYTGEGISSRQAMRCVNSIGNLSLRNMDSHELTHF